MTGSLYVMASVTCPRLNAGYRPALQFLVAANADLAEASYSAEPVGLGWRGEFLPFLLFGDSLLNQRRE